MKQKKPLSREDMQKKLKEAAQQGSTATTTKPPFIKIITPVPRTQGTNIYDVPLQGKTGRPVAKTFGENQIPNSKIINTWDRLKNKWEDPNYGAEKKKKKGIK